jgi:RNA methyltransferase, TrmH family
MITSVDNPRVKQARALLTRKHREQLAYCLVEGVRLVEDAMRAGIRPALLFYVSDAGRGARAAAVLEATLRAGVPSLELAPAVFATLSDTVSSQGLLAIVPIPNLPFDAAAGMVLILDRLRDPGNMGTILRSAEAAGAAAVFASRGCVDPYNPKVLRAGMGSHFRLALRADVDWATINSWIGGRTLWAADISGELSYDRVDWTEPCALVIGGETTGLSAEAMGLGARKVYIPMQGPVDSLNAAMATTVLLFEAARQRRAAAASGERGAIA